MDVTVPDMGESVIEATVARWIKQEGDAVLAGEPLVELETDKVNVEVSAQQAGVLAKVLRQPGETVRVGDVLATIQPTGTTSTAEDLEAEIQREVPPPAPGQTMPPAASEQGDTTPAPVPSAAAQVTPVARRMAEELGIDLKRVPPSGGRITKADVQAYVESAPQTPPVPPAAPARPRPAPEPPPAAPRPAPAPARPGEETRERMSRRRQTIARRLVEAQHTAAMLTTFNEIDMSAVMDMRKRRREGFKQRFGVDLGLMPFFVKGVVAALKAFPYLNAEIQGEEIVLKHYYDIGIAVGSEEGLVVPVLRSADRLSFADIEKAIRGFVEKVKAGTLTLEDLRGGTFTITNGGVYGSLLSTPILNPPQVGILGMHRIQERPVVVDGQIAARPMMYVALSYDHRIVDGQTAVQFLVRVKELLEDPENLLFG